MFVFAFVCMKNAHLWDSGICNHVQCLLVCSVTISVTYYHYKTIFDEFFEQKTAKFGTLVLVK